MVAGKMKTVYVVHCVDTEGPLHESLEATFGRLREIFGVDLPPSRETLRQLQAGKLELGGIEKEVRRVFSPALLAYNSDWPKIDVMLEHCLGSDFRNSMPDSNGGGWIYNWFCVDHVDYEMNPRRRDIGFHNIFDHYRFRLQETGSLTDGLHFHFHPHSFLKHAQVGGTRWLGEGSPLDQVLCRRIIDRSWFPSVNRPGFHTNRPDSHWFLEQYIPFDFSNQAVKTDPEEGKQADLSGGRFGDWRRAPKTWVPYHPDHDDYQSMGRCRRWIARCLNVGTRLRLLGEDNVREAFQEADAGRPVVLAFTDHDFRDVRPDVDTVRSMLASVSREFPGVRYVYSEALEAMRLALDLPKEAPCRFNLSLNRINDGLYELTIESDKPIFGPQPYLAIKTVTQGYYHDNLDIHEPYRRWSYFFDGQTIPLPAVEKIGLAANNAYGATSVFHIEPATGKIETHQLHA